MRICKLTRHTRKHKCLYLILKTLLVWYIIWLTGNYMHRAFQFLWLTGDSSDRSTNRIRDIQLIRDEEPKADYNWLTEMASAMEVLRVYSLPDRTSHYKIASYIAPALSYSNYIPKREEHSTHYMDLTLATQCSSNNLHYLPALAKRFKGPVSVAVFYVGPDLTEAIQEIISLRHCYIDVRRYVSFHMVYTANHLINKQDTWTLLPCSHFNDPAKNLSRKSVQNYVLKIPYPNNLLRNVAFKAIFTEFVLLTDVDMLPSKRLRTDFVELALPRFAQSDTCDKVAYVLPVFEMDTSQYPPANKVELLDMLNAEEAQVFYEKLCFECHASRYMEWTEQPYANKLQIVSEEFWEPPWEPFSIVRKDAPLYDERFRQYGDNRVSQNCEMHMSGYTYVILSDAFLIHLGLKKESDFHATRHSEMEENDLLYEQFRQELIKKYPNTWRRCV